MRLSILPLAIIAFASAVHAQDVIEWSDKRKLTFADFKKLPGNEPPERIILHVDVRTELDRAALPFLKNFNAQVTSLFYPAESWIAETNKTGLRYCNTAFDIYEWSCREFRKRLAENRDLVLQGKIGQIADELNHEFQTIFEAYDAETQYASNLLEQMKWESRINQQLFALSAYCKSCGEAKMN